jgi:hypothetical protein
MMNKNHVRLMMILGFLTALSVSASPMVPAKVAVPYALKNTFKQKAVLADEVDLTLSNNLIQAIMDQLTATEDQVEWAKPKFDTELSSLQKERIVYSATAGVKNTPWSSSVPTLLEGRADFNADRTAWIPGIQTKATAKLNTELLSFLRYSAKIAQANVRGPDPAFEAKINELLNRGTQLQDMPAFYNLIVESQKVAIDYLTRQLKKDQDYLDCLYAMTCGSPVIDQWGNRTYNNAEVMSQSFSIEKKRRMRASYESLVISTNSDQSVITIYAPAPQGFLKAKKDMPEAKTATAVFSNNQITFETVLFSEVSIADLDKTHKTLVDNLTGLANGDAQSRANVESNYREALVRFKKAMNGQARY